MRSRWRCGSTVYSRFGSFVPLRKKKATTALTASAPGGGSLASTGGSLQCLMQIAYLAANCCDAIHGLLSRFVGRLCLDRERMDVALHQVLDRRVNQSMPSHR